MLLYFTMPPADCRWLWPLSARELGWGMGAGFLYLHFYTSSPHYATTFIAEVAPFRECATSLPRCQLPLRRWGRFALFDWALFATFWYYAYGTMTRRLAPLMMIGWNYIFSLGDTLEPPRASSQHYYTIVIRMISTIGSDAVRATTARIYHAILPYDWLLLNIMQHIHFRNKHAKTPRRRSA